MEHRSGLARGVLAVTVLFAASLPGPSASADVVDFDDLTLAPNSYWNGPDPNGTVVQGPYGPEVLGRFRSHGTTFINRYEETYKSWSGFAYSNTTDTTTPGFTNQFSAFTGSGRGPGADNYGVAFGYSDLPPVGDFDPSDPAQLASLPTFLLPQGRRAAGMYVTNTTYAALSMMQGDSFAKEFGGTTGDDPDYFLLSVYGTDASGKALAPRVDFYLADFRFSDNRLDYIVSDWTYLDLSALRDATALHFNVSSTDVGQFGLNTPAYFAVDDIQLAAVPEPGSMALLACGLAGLALAGKARRNRP